VSGGVRAIRTGRLIPQPGYLSPEREYELPAPRQRHSLCIHSSSIDSRTYPAGLHSNDSWEVAVRFFGQAINAVPALQAQEYTDLLVARLELTLCALIVADLLCVVEGLALMIAALQTSYRDE
jgi:hypothetical protein